MNVRPEIIKLLEENIGAMLFDTGLSNIFLDMSLRERETKTKTYKWDYIKQKSFCTANETINKIKRQDTEWKNIFADDILNMGLMFKILIYKKVIKLNNQNHTTLLQNRQGGRIDIFPKKIYRWPTGT